MNSAEKEVSFLPEKPILGERKDESLETQPDGLFAPSPSGGADKESPTHSGIRQGG